MQNQIVQHEQASNLRQEVVDAGVSETVAQLVDDKVVGLCPVALEKLAGWVETHGLRQSRTVDLLLIVVDVDRVARGQQLQNLDAVVGDSGGGRR